MASRHLNVATTQQRFDYGVRWLSMGICEHSTISATCILMGKAFRKTTRRRRGGTHSRPCKAFQMQREVSAQLITAGRVLCRTTRKQPSGAHWPHSKDLWERSQILRSFITVDWASHRTMGKRQSGTRV